MYEKTNRYFFVLSIVAFYFCLTDVMPTTEK